MGKEQTFAYPQDSSGWASNLTDARQISQRKYPNVIPYLQAPHMHEGFGGRKGDIGDLLSWGGGAAPWGLQRVTTGRTEKS